MRTPLEVIAGYGVSTTSYIRAIQQFNDLDHSIILKKEQYEKGIADIVGGDHPPSFSSEKEARIYFLYVIQETIRSFSQGTIPEMDHVWEDAQRRAKQMIINQPWAVKDYCADDEGEPKLDAAGNPKKRKGAKKDEAEALYKRMNDGNNDRTAIIAALIDEVGMSKAGATTYFHNLKKQFGFSGPKTEKPKRQRKTQIPSERSLSKPTKNVSRKGGPTKAEIAKQIYTSLRGRSKEDVIAEIIAKTGTSKAGANTYYCSCKRELGE